MNPSDTARLLAATAAYDRRTVGEMDVLAWHKAIGDLDLDEAIEAVARHYGHSTDWCQPAHVRAGVNALHAEQRDAARAEREELERQQRYAALDNRPVADRSDELQALLKSTAEKLATTESSRQRAILVARRMRGTPTATPPRRTTPPVRAKRGDYPPPKTAETAEYARHLLWDGYKPDDVAERLYISRRWCRRAAREPDPRPPEQRADRPPVVRQPANEQALASQNTPQSTDLETAKT